MVPVFSIRTKITLCFIAVVVSMSGAFAVLSYLHTMKAMHVEMEKHGTEVVKILSQTIAPYVFESDYVTVIDIANRILDNSDIKSVSIVNAGGRTWMSTSGDQAPIASNDVFYNSILEDKRIHSRIIELNGSMVVESVSPIKALGKVVYLLKILVSIERAEQQALQRFNENIAIGFSMICVAILMAIYLARQLTAPLKDLVQGTRELSQGNFSHRIAVKVEDEVGLLSKSFNSMAASLESELSIRMKVERQLKEYTDSLEEIVSERTALLTQTNSKLSLEIEKHKSTQADLIETKDRYRRFSEVTIDGIVFVNNTGIIDTNSSFTDMFDYSFESVAGRDLLEVLCLPEGDDAIRDKITSGEAISVEATARTKSGKTLEIELQSRPLESKDTFLSVFFIRDISKRKQLESQLRQAQRMEGIGKLAAGIAHDLNNILSGIVTLPQLLMMDLPEDSPLKDPLQLIQKSGDSAAVIVQDMLTLANSGLHVGQVLNPRDLVRNYILSPESMKLTKTHPGVKIRLSICENINNIKGSPVHLAKLLMNLVYNAADAIEGEGEITISLNNEYLDVPLGSYDKVSEGDYICISVKDSGTGIQPQDLSQIFEPFYTKKVLGRTGTGLGMPIVWNTVKDHQGYIDIKSGVGIGTEIRIFLPVTYDALHQSQNEPDLLSLKGCNETILIVDDIEAQRKIASAILEKLNYQTRCVSGGVDALEFLQSQSVDLILLDMIMEPGISGLETCKRLFAIRPDSRVIIASGYAASEMVTEAMELGALLYIKKPYSIATLGSAVKNALEN